MKNLTLTIDEDSFVGKDRVLDSVVKEVLVPVKEIQLLLKKLRKVLKLDTDDESDHLENNNLEKTRLPTMICWPKKVNRLSKKVPKSSITVKLKWRS